MRHALRSFRARGSGRPGIPLLLLLAVVACAESTPPPTSQPVEFQVNADVGEGEPGRSVGVTASYRRASGEQVPLTVDPATIDIPGGAVAAGAVSVDVLPCLRDSNREPASGAAAGGCVVHLVAQLRAPNGTPVSTEEIAVPVARRASSVVVESFDLPSGKLVLSTTTVNLVLAESGLTPGPVTIDIGSSTALLPGELSASIEYLNGTGWLSATTAVGGGSVTIAAASLTLAPGTYHAVVRVTSERMFEPAEIAVQYQVAHPAKSVTITGAGNGTGLVLVTPSGASCTSTAGQVSGICSVPAPHGSISELTPAPAVGSGFAGWSGACQGMGSCILTMDQTRAVMATFVLLTRELTIDASGPGSGMVTSSPTGLSCTATAGAESGTCVAGFDHLTQVTLSAAPAQGSTFTGWSGPCQGTGSCVVTMSEARAVTANFGLVQWNLTLTMVGEGAGSVVSDPAGLECTVTGPGQTSKTCIGQFAHGTTVVLAASPAATMTFSGWSGACTGTGTCAVIMDAAKSVTATIVSPRYPLTVIRSGDAGTWSLSPTGYSCTSASGDSCTREFAAGTVVTVSAAVGSSVGLATIGGACSASQGGGFLATCQFVMDAPRTVSVTFDIVSTDITILGSGDGVGVVSGSSGMNSIHCTIMAGQTSGTCRSVAMGMLQQSLTMTATPQAGSVFGGWVGCPSASGAQCTVGAFTEVKVTGIFNLAPSQTEPAPRSVP